MTDPAQHKDQSKDFSVIVIAGPGGVGKGTVVTEILRSDPNLWLSRSWTTRGQRPTERADAYHFVTPTEFQAHVDAGGFLEWAEFLGNRYGTPWPVAPAGADVVLEIDVQGAAQVVAREPKALLVFLVPPSHDELERRLRGRGDPDEKVRERLQVARDEQAQAEGLGARLVVNDDLDRAVDEVLDLIHEARQNPS